MKQDDWTLIKRDVTPPGGKYAGDLYRCMATGEFTLSVAGLAQEVPYAWARQVEEGIRIMSEMPAGERAARARKAAIARWGSGERRSVGSLTREEWTRLDEAAEHGHMEGDWQPTVARVCRLLHLSTRSSHIVEAVLYSRLGLPLPAGGVRY